MANKVYYHKSAVRADEVVAVGPNGTLCFVQDQDPSTSEPLEPTNLGAGDLMQKGDMIVLEQDPDHLVTKPVVLWYDRAEFFKYYTSKI